MAQLAGAVTVLLLLLAVHHCDGIPDQQQNNDDGKNDQDGLQRVPPMAGP
jgi:hypothetical protein